MSCGNHAPLPGRISHQLGTLCRFSRLSLREIAEGRGISADHFECWNGQGNYALFPASYGIAGSTDGNNVVGREAVASRRRHQR